MSSFTSQQTQEIHFVLRQWTERPDIFVEQVFQVKLQRWQRLALLAIAKNDLVAIRSGHGVGKSVLLAWVIIWFLTINPKAKVGCTAPTFHQLEDILWNELGTWWRRMPEQMHASFRLTQNRFVVVADPTSFAVARTARKENPEAFQGLHSSAMLFIGDEASGIDNKIFEVAEGALSTPGAKVLLAGNPTRTSGYFFDCFHKMRKLWHCIHVPCSEGEFVSPDYAERVAARYGEDSNVYRVRVGGDFPKTEDDRIISLEMIEGAMMRDVKQYGPIVWGVDPARFGDDRTVLIKRWGNKLPHPAEQWRKRDTMWIADKIKLEYDTCPPMEKPNDICIDVIGIGAGVVDRCRQLGLPVTAVNVAEAAATKEFYNRKRDELWHVMRDWFLEGDVVICEDDDLHAELLAVPYKILPGGKIKVEDKDEIKKELGYSPDCADALVLTFASTGRKVQNLMTEPLEINIGTIA